MALTKIPGNLIETGAITGDVLADGGIATAKLADDAVTTDKILDANITHAKLHATMDLTGKTVTVATAAGSTNTTAAASTAFVQQELTTLIGGAPGTLDTLNELAAAINDDDDYHTTLTTALATKLPLAGGTLTGHLNLGDNVQARFGTDNDLQIYHDGSHARLRTATGNFNIQTNDFHLTDASNVAVSFLVDHDGATSIRYNQYEKLATTNTGIAVTGTGSIVNTASGVTKALKLYNNTLGANNRVGIDFHTANTLYGTIEAGYGASAPEMNFKVGNAPAQILKLTSTGIDVTGNVGIGTTAPSSGLHLTGADNTKSKLTLTNTAPTPDNTWSLHPIYNGQDLLLNEDSDTRVTFQSGGNVGIGTDSPPSPLSIFGTGTSSPIAANAQQSYDNALFRINNFANSSVGLSIGSTGSNVTHIQTSYNEGTTSPLVLNPFGGNVGIGTDSPAHSLDVNGNIRIRGTSGRLYFDTLGAGSSNFVGTINDYETVVANERGSAGFGVFGNSNIRFGFGTTRDSSETDLYISNSDGKVGIGTSSPNSPLHVLKNAGSNVTPIATFDTSSTDDYGIVVIDSGVDNNYRPSTLRFHEGGNLKWEIGGVYQLVDDTFGIRNSSGAYKMVIQQDGKVGIGTTAPSSLLDVRGGLGADGTAATPTAYFINSQSGATSGSIYIGASSGIDWKIGKNVTGILGNVNFSIADSSGNRRFDIDATGNVGIGTTAPAHKLQVEGAIKTNPPVATGNKQRDVQTWETNIYTVGTTATNWDMTKFNEGGAGNSFLVEAFWAHYAAKIHCLSLMAVVHIRGTTVFQQTILDSTDAYTGSFTISAPSSTTLRINKTAGTYGGGGYGYIRVTSYQS